MSIQTPINHSFNVDCPKCNHKYLYDIHLDDIKEVSSSSTKTQYTFTSYVICKNPICNYDIELKGSILEHPKDNIDSISLIKIK